MANSNILMVYVQCDGNAPITASLEVLSRGAELSKSANFDHVAVVIGKVDETTEKTIKSFGVSKILEVESDVYNLQAYGEKLAKVVEKYSPKLLISGTTPMAKDVLGYAAAKVGSSPIANVSKIEIDSEIVFTTGLYGGAVLRDVTLNTEKTKFAMMSKTSVSSDIEEVPCEIIKENFEVKDLYTVIKESVTEIAESVNLEEAEVIVTCGRGIGNEDGIKLVEELASVLGGAVGATRPVTESGIVARTQQVGQSGKIVAPKIYIGCGVSGATQHVSGILGSDYIVAINKDEDAPIFEVADVGIVGDAMAVLPLFIEEIKKIKA